MGSPSSESMPIFRGSKRRKVYMDAVDKNVSKTIIYVNNFTSGDNNFTPYADEAGTKVFSADELLDAYLKGAVASISTPDGNDTVVTLLSANRLHNTNAHTVGVSVEFMFDGQKYIIVATSLTD